MADAGNPIDPNDLGELTAETERFGDVTQSLNLQLERTSNLLNSIPSGIFDTVGKSASISARDVNRLTQDVEKLKKGAKDIRFGMDPLGDLVRTSKPSDVRDAIGGAMLAAAQVVNRAFTALQEMAKNTTQGIAAIGTIGFAKAKTEAIEFLELHTGYVKLEKQLMDIQKSALQIGMSFGESYTGASKSVGFFESSMSDTMKTLKATEEELKATRSAMKEAFAAREMFGSIENLDLSLEGVVSSVNLTNVALAVSKATGMDVADVASKMADMHLRLGTSVEDTATAFGHIRDAAKESGLTYKAVSDTVIDSAKTLKFYGSTVEAVSPIFKAFNQSLKGIGKEGLTPELLKDFVGGLQQMQLNTRALLGLRMPGAGRGILGGALRVERAMETGEGMGDVIKSLTDTMKQFGGQQLVTREEALDSPAAERNYIIQRQILGQLTGIRDAGKQNQMMQILNDIDKHGIESGKDAERQLGELMAAGEKTAEETTDTLTKAQLQYQRTRIDQGTQIIDHLKTMASEVGLRKLLKSSDDIIDAVTTSIGDINFEVVDDTLSKLSGEQTKLTNAVKDTTMQGQSRKTAERAMGQTVTEKTTLDITAEYNKAVISAIRETKPGSMAREKYIKTGAVTQDIHNKALAEAQRKANERLEKIKETIGQGGTKDLNTRALIIEKEGIERALKKIGQGTMLKRKPGPIDQSAIVKDIINTTDEVMRTRTGLMPATVPKTLGPTHETRMPPAAQEINGEITVKVRVDQDGRLVTEDHVVRIVKGEIRDEGTGAKKY